MKLLKIEEGQGYFLLPDQSYREIDKISKEDLVEIIGTVLSKDVDFDIYTDDGLLNPAQKIVYKNIGEKLQNLAARREEYKGEVENLFKKEFDKYSSSGG